MASKEGSHTSIVPNAAYFNSLFENHSPSWSSSDSNSDLTKSSNSNYWGIEEEDNDDEEEYFDAKNEVTASMSPLQGKKDVEEDCVYVAVGKTKSSMDALAWTLVSNVINPTTTIYLVHVFPHVRNLPAPLGALRRHKASPTVAEKYMSEEREKRKALLQNYLDLCSSFQIMNKVDAVLIESDEIAKTLLCLVPLLKIKKLVLGTTSRKAKLRKNGIAHQIYMNVPTEMCEVMLVCQGKQVENPTFATPALLSPTSSRKSVVPPPPHNNQLKSPPQIVANQRRPSAARRCMCFPIARANKDILRG